MFWAVETEFKQNSKIILDEICNILGKVTKRIWKTHNTERKFLQKIVKFLYKERNGLKQQNDRTAGQELL